MSTVSVLRFPYIATLKYVICDKCFSRWLPILTQQWWREGPFWRYPIWRRNWYPRALSIIIASIYSVLLHWGYSGHFIMDWLLVNCTLFTNRYSVPEEQCWRLQSTVPPTLPSCYCPVFMPSPEQSKGKVQWRFMNSLRRNGGHHRRRRLHIGIRWCLSISNGARRRLGYCSLPQDHGYTNRLCRGIPIEIEWHKGHWRKRAIWTMNCSWNCKMEWPMDWSHSLCEAMRYGMCKNEEFVCGFSGKYVNPNGVNGNGWIRMFYYIQSVPVFVCQIENVSPFVRKT